VNFAASVPDTAQTVPDQRGHSRRSAKPLLLERRPRPKGGRPPVDDRKLPEGTVFVLRTGIGPVQPAGRSDFADWIDRLLAVDVPTSPRRWAVGQA
jgi:hypothetical protein